MSTLLCPLFPINKIDIRRATYLGSGYAEAMRFNLAARGYSNTPPDLRVQNYLWGPVALRDCVVAPSAARYSRNWATSLREPSAFAVCSISLA
jgi:hypothetical protein